MIQHLLKLIWNRKKSNMLMIMEIFLSFLVLFAVSSVFINNIHNYLQPLGFAYDKVWSLSLKKAPMDESVQQQAEPEKQTGDQIQHIRILDQLKSYTEVEAFSASGSNVPYSFNTRNSTVSNGNASAVSYIYSNDDHYPDVAGLHLVEGRWFNAADDASRLPPLVINRLLRNKIFNGETAIGKTLKFDGKEGVVVGVIDDYRAKGEFSSPTEALFERISRNDSGDLAFDNVLIKVKPGVGAAFEEKLLTDLDKIVPAWTFEISSLNKMRETQHKLTKVPMIAMLIICGFLIINVALGLFGVLWYNINRRYSEIGLRRATGATSGKIQFQFLGEVLVLATLGVVLGCFIAMQFPLLNVFNVATMIYLLALVISIVLIYSLAVICAWYPGREAAKIEPAVALHDE